MSQLPKTILTTQLRTGAVLLSSLILAACATNDKPSYQLADIIKANPIDSTNPGTGNPGTGNPGTGNPGTGNPGTGNPGTGNPGTGNPGTGNPGTGNPGTGNPGSGNPDSGSPENPDAPATEMTGYQTITLSKPGAVGYNQFWDDKSDFKETKEIKGNVVAIDNRQGNNFTNFNTIKARADMTKPSAVTKSADITLTGNKDAQLSDGFYKYTGTGTVQSKEGGELSLKYDSVYKNFDNQMQIGQVYGDPKVLFWGRAARVSGAYVQGYLTDTKDLNNLKLTNKNDVIYKGNATYLEKLHFNDQGERGVLIGTSKITVNFPKNSIKGELLFKNDDKQQYFPEGGKINFETFIHDDGTFKSNQSNLDVQGAFYGEDAKYVGGIYQDVLATGGKGETVGQGTRFQGTFGAVKQ